jgi:hypothetical protein
MRLRNILLAGAAILLAVTTYQQGIMSERWGTFPELELFAQRLPSVPSTVGEWVGNDIQDVDQREREIARIVGSLSRSYKDSKGNTVNVFLVCGRLSDMYYHTPERCYPAAGYVMGGSTADISVPAGKADARFKSASFQKSDQKDYGRIYWSWSVGKSWETSDQSKWRFQGQRAMYKLYVVCKDPQGDSGESNAEALPAVDFLKAFVPAVAPVLDPERPAPPPAKA